MQQVQLVIIVYLGFGFRYLKNEYVHMMIRVNWPFSPNIFGIMDNRLLLSSNTFFGDNILWFYGKKWNLVCNSFNWIQYKCNWNYICILKCLLLPDHPIQNKFIQILICHLHNFQFQFGTGFLHQLCLHHLFISSDSGVMHSLS